MQSDIETDGQPADGWHHSTSMERSLLGRLVNRRNKVKAEKPPKYIPKQLVGAEALSPVSLQLSFSKPLAPEELEAAPAYLKLSGGLQVTGCPRLKNGSRASYIVPTSLQQPGKRYACAFRGGDKLGFRAGVDRIFFRRAVACAYDTVELAASLGDAVVDVGRVTEAVRPEFAGSGFELSADNVFEGRYYQIVPPLDGLTVQISPERGQTLEATYIPGTQLASARQAPRFRLPAGFAFTSGQRYAVSAEWARIGQDEFTAPAYRLPAPPHSASPHSAPPHSASPHSASPHSASPHSASPHSAPPHSAPPHSASPHSASPHSASPHSASPHSASPHSAPPHSAPMLPSPKLPAPAPERLRPLAALPAPSPARRSSN
ncbi:MULTISPECIES: hypothetical protein [Paenibacillus]|uniref:hypothetical protein n=1 Tax=Paenibacillus TaxID=44249 RepID=UPI00040D251D|nr:MULTISPECIES: hypothetical protein [Paenibacillus]QGG57759.1 hypothetical protein GE073_20775 [Paenibacillus sp. B01]